MGHHTHLLPNSKLLLKQNEFIGVLTMLHQTSNRLFQEVMITLKFIILGYLTAKKYAFFVRCRDFCAWSIKSSSIWKVMPMPSRHHAEYNTLRDNARGVVGWAGA